jgi:hypothetical protein
MPEFVAAVDGIAEKMYSVFLDVAFKTMQNAVEKRTGVQFVAAGNSTSHVNNSRGSTPSSPLLTAHNSSSVRFTTSLRSGPSPQ